MSKPIRDWPALMKPLTARRALPARRSMHFDASRARKGIGFDEARPILWMYTRREIYRRLVIEGG